MDFRFSEEQQELGAIARSFLEEASGPEQIRSAMASELGYDPEIWAQIGSELGWACVHIPEEFGGLGLGYVDLVVLLEATGEFVLCSPFFATVALGANTILSCGSSNRPERGRGSGSCHSRSSRPSRRSGPRSVAAGTDSRERP